jgi:hypothetical protein
VFPVSYELSFYIPEDDFLHSHRRDSVSSYNMLVLGKTGGNTTQNEFMITVKESILLSVGVCCLVDGYTHLGGMYCTRLQGTLFQLSYLMILMI